jgi:hypothetical protein
MAMAVIVHNAILSVIKAEDIQTSTKGLCTTIRSRKCNIRVSRADRGHFRSSKRIEGQRKIIVMHLYSKGIMSILVMMLLIGRKILILPISK